MQTTYLSCAETAKLVRKALKRAFPATKFSVRSDTYSMGASIDVSWTDGPTTALVDHVANQFKAASFDSSIDMKISRHHWLLADGSATLASTPGTEGSTGCIPAERHLAPEPGARLVHLGSDYIHTSRSVSPALAARVLMRVRAKYQGFEGVEVRTNSFGAYYAGDALNDFHQQQILNTALHRFMSVRG